tara:strand:+ start:86 stop:448 length:363 start_codon:yes stop_codon:yes gene_type:complete
MRNKPKIKPAKLTLDFLTFHRDNPQIYELFVRFASEVARTRNRFGSRAILERIRWETAVESRHETLKIPNAYSAYYSRLFEIDHPRFDGMFQHNTSIANELYDLKITRKKDAQLTFSFYN